MVYNITNIKMYNLEEETLMKKYIKSYLISLYIGDKHFIAYCVFCSAERIDSFSFGEKSANETVYAFVGKDIQNPYSQKVLRVLKPPATK